MIQGFEIEEEEGRAAQTGQKRLGEGGVQGLTLSGY
jgi:hypothetical protein